MEVEVPMSHAGYTRGVEGFPETCYTDSIRTWCWTEGIVTSAATGGQFQIWFQTRTCCSDFVAANSS